MYTIHGRQEERQNEKMDAEDCPLEVRQKNADACQCGDCTDNGDYAVGFNNIDDKVNEETVNGTFENTE